MLYAAMQAGKGDAIYSETEFFGGKNGIYTLPTPTKWNMLSYNSVVCSALYRKSEWEKYGGYDQACAVCGCEDWDFWLNFMADGKRFYKIDQVWFYYRQQEVSRNAGARQMETSRFYLLILSASSKACTTVTICPSVLQKSHFALYTRKSERLMEPQW